MVRKVRLDIAAGWSVPSPMCPPDPAAADAASAEDALFALILQVLEQAMELASDAGRSARLDELSRLTSDLDLFARAALSAQIYAAAG